MAIEVGAEEPSQMLEHYFRDNETAANEVMRTVHALRRGRRCREQKWRRRKLGGMAGPVHALTQAIGSLITV